MSKKLLFSALLLLSPSLMASQVSLNYADFYARMKVMNKGNYQLIDLAFTVPETQNCQVKAGSISTETERFPLTFDAGQRLFIPFDEKLKNTRALINLEIAGEGQGCGIGMQLRVRNPKQEYSGDELRNISSQMNEALKQMQGFPMKYFAKPISGLSIEFSGSENGAWFDGRHQALDKRYELSNEEIALLETLKFDATPKVISPWVAPDK
ncbi:DUF2987 domain-containing protein [Shewanella algae]|uniref:DUF2987 domain-containing protein n=1 Tax=Shewanella algae TaxID=38313 RepID=UPI001655FD81|nr:DUF2987 domain-containing protein [Shewanella algae]MBC8795169.1 DUF2987 domain-containing protein [Shewanella algae]